MTRLATGVAGALLLAMSAMPAMAVDHEILMLNQGSDGEPMVYEPAFLKIEPGDTVKFVATDRTHNTESVAGMIPEGAESFRGRINEELEVTFTEPGIYGIKCLPHYGMGMVALIQVGDDTSNLEEAKAVRHPGRARDRMTGLFEELEVATQ